MEKSSPFFGRLAAIVLGALALGACNRAEYAMLPHSASYLGTKTVASTPRPAASVAARPEAMPAVPAAAVAPTAEAVAPAPVAPAPVVAAAPTVQPVPAPATKLAQTAPTKLNFAQRLALHKVAKKLDKLTAKAPLLKQRDASAGTTRLDSGLRTALVVLLIGVIVAAFSGVGSFFAIIGGILIIIGLVLLLLYLLDQV